MNDDVAKDIRLLLLLLLLQLVPSPVVVEPPELARHDLVFAHFDALDAGERPVVVDDQDVVRSVHSLGLGIPLGHVQHVLVHVERLGAVASRSRNGRREIAACWGEINNCFHYWCYN